MPVSTYYKQQSKSASLPVSQLTKKKTPSLTSSQCKRCLTDKLPSRNFSSGFKPKGLRLSQDRECDALCTSCGHSDGREIGNFNQGHHKQRKIPALVWASKPDGYKWRIMNRQQPHATGESEKKKLETEESKLGNRHNDPDHMVNEKISHKYLRRKWKKKAKKIANSKADADSSSYKHVGDFKQGHREQGKIQAIVVATKSGWYERQIMNRQQSHATVETEKTKIQTKEDKLGNHHIYQDHMVNEKIWYKYLWRKWKKKAKQIANSKADADSSSYKSISDEKQMIIHKSQIKSIKTLATKRPSDSTRNKLEENFACVKDLIFQNSKIVKILSWEKDLNCKIGRAIDVLKKSYLQHKTLMENCDEKDVLREIRTELQRYIEKKHTMGLKIGDLITCQEIDKTNFQLTELMQESEDKKIYVLPEKVRKFIKRSILSELKCAAADERTFYPCDSRRASYSTLNFFEEHFMFGCSEDFEVNNESQCSDIYISEPSVQARIRQEHLYKFLPTPVVSSDVAILNQNMENEENEDTLDVVHGKDNVDEEKKDRNIEEGHVTQGHQKGNEDEEEEAGEKFQETGANQVTSENLDMHSTMDQIQDEINVLVEEARRKLIKRSKSIESERHKSTQESEGSANEPIHHTDICSDDRRTTFDSQEDKSTGMPGSMVNENGSKVQAKQISRSEANTDISSNESLSTVESTAIRLYRDVIRNETSRMMSSIDRVVSEAVHLFGFERSQIFFDLLLDEELCQFESAGAISEFVPNMVESIVSQNVISFFEHAHDMMNILMTLLLRCPDINILQQMPVQDFTSSIKSVIKSSLKTKTKGREKLSLEGKIYTMVDSKDFERSLGEEIPENVLYRHNSGDEMAVHRFVDTRLETHQLSDRRDNRPIHSIYFPSDCRLFIYIPTENGSYWHQLDMRRADRIHQHSK